ncbi:TlpA family protein disulfide reductase [Cytobacillus sp. IB215665]|uniref:TlpA family protein disulfide reductase n=1 Tax=Cytobacillus sp. IB215665 TaxID=3097357 RepID=UPI002A16BF0C|nr:thioredoxin-like domain-containing protein [Cytobacillus sp. IB215665]MDX8365385.1 thioredoxin-like domain-containing protein [Cytobacillus sp. IB215665]
MDTKWIVLIIVLFIIVLSLVILNIRMLKLIGRYIQYVESFQGGFTPKKIDKIPNMKIKSDLNDEVTLYVDENLDQDLLLVFISPGCSACKSIYPHLNSSLNKYQNVFTMVVVDSNAEEENSEYFDHFVKEGLHYVNSKKVYDDIGISSVPYVMYVGKNRQVLEQGYPSDADYIYQIADKHNSSNDTKLIG